MKKALVTGANSGIGLEIAKQLASNGYSVTGVARNLEKLQKEFKNLEGENHQTFSADLSTKEGIEVAKSLLKEKYDVLVNNAGRGYYGTFHSNKIKDLNKMNVLNITALTELSYEYLKTAKKGDALINVASVLAFTSFADATVYAGTKAYVVNMSQGLWAEYAKKGILVQAFCPGATKSAFHDTAGGDTSQVPQFIFQTSKACAAEFMKGLKKRKGPVVISGRLNRIFAYFSRILGPKQMAKIQGSNSMS